MCKYAAMMLIFFATLANAETSSPEIVVLKATDSGSVAEPVKYLGDKVYFQVNGLESSTDYRLDLWQRSQNKLTRSWAVLSASKAGSIDTMADAPESGTYDVANADGLFWSLEPVSETTTLEIPEGGYCLTVTLTLGSENIATKCFSQVWLKPTASVADLNIADHGFIGKLVVPQESKSNSIVVTISGSEGGLSSSFVNSIVLANNGIASLAVAYFGLPGLPSGLERIPLEYFESVFAYLKTNPAVAAKRIILLGPSRGSELSLLLGSRFSEVKGVIAVVPGNITWGANTETGNVSAWTWRGEDLPFLNSVGGLDAATDYHGNAVLSNRGAFERGYAAVPSSSRPYIRVEDIGGPVLLLGAEDDQMWPSCLFGREALERLKTSGHAFNDKFLCFDDAGHDIFPPGVSAYTRSYFHEHMGVTLTMGGTPKAAGIAYRLAWDEIIKFAQ